MIPIDGKGRLGFRLNDGLGIRDGYGWRGLLAR